MLFSVVIPMYNEKTIAKDCASSLVKRLESSAMDLSFEYEMIFSDDGSSDGCGDIVKEFISEASLGRGSMRVIRQDVNRGKGSAVRKGILDSAGDVVLFTDSDLAYGADAIIDMLLSFTSEENGADILIGSRKISEDGYSGYSFIRSLASKIYVKLLSLGTGFSYTDSQCGIKMFRGDVGRRIFSLCETDGWAFDFEALIIAERLGFKVREFPVKVINHRESKINLVKDSIKMVSEVGKIKKRVSKMKVE